MSRTFEVYEDEAGEHRWRLRADNGNVVADSGEGYDSRDGALRAVERVRERSGDARVTAVDRAAFEVYEDAEGRHRWQLRHPNGNVLADSGQGYSSRDGARAAVERLRGNVGDAGESEVSN